MLQTIRNVVSGWVAVVFVALLIIPFAFWGIDSYFGGGANVNVASVNGVDISLQEYQRSYQNIRQQWQEISPALAEQTEFLRQQTLDSLIDRVLLLELKESLGFRVSDEQVRAAIFEIPIFRNPEGFDTVRYQSYLRSMGYSPAQFEAQMREDITLQQLQAGLLQTIFVSPSEVTSLAALDNEMRDITYAQIYLSDHESEIEVTEAEIEAFYNEHRQEFMSPEQVRVAYLQLSIDNIASQISVDEQALRSFFENARANYSITERRKVRQILVYADNEDEESKQRAEAVARELYTQVASGLTFDQAREQYAEDEQITVEISDFGYLNPGVLDPEINDVAFNSEIGVISEPILSAYGYQLVIVDDITGGTVAEFEDVQAEIARDYRLEQAERRFFDLYDELAVLTYEHPDTLDIAAESLGIAVRESLSINRLGANEALLNDQKVIAAAFSDEVLINRNNSQLIELAPNQIVVLRVIEHTPQQQTPLADVRDQVIAEVRLDKGSAITRNRGEQIIARINQGDQIEVLAEEFGIDWREEMHLKRDSYYVTGEILETAFKAGRPEPGEPLLAGVAVAEGDYAVIIVNNVHDLEPDSLTSEQTTPISDYIKQATASKSWSLMMADLRAKADIQIFEVNM
jgi:peptidyl-prolyl cis-trans isomerase D